MCEFICMKFRIFLLSVYIIILYIRTDNVQCNRHNVQTDRHNVQSSRHSVQTDRHDVQTERHVCNVERTQGRGVRVD